MMQAKGPQKINVHRQSFFSEILLIRISNGYMSVSARGSRASTASGRTRRQSHIHWHTVTLKNSPVIFMNSLRDKKKPDSI